MSHGFAVRPQLAAPLVAVAIAFGANCCDAAAAPAPAASTGSATHITFISAVLHGTVNPHGAPANFAFQYGLSRHYVAQTPLAGAGSGSSSVNASQAINGLRPATTYHYRLVVYGIATVAGGDRTFTTPTIPLSLAIRGAPNPVLFGSPFLVEGNLSGSGNSARRVVLKIRQFPYLGAFTPFGAPALTDASGAFSFFVPGLLQNAELFVTMLGKPSVSSPLVLEGVATRVVLHVRHTGRRGFVRFYGTVAPAEVGALVGIQRLRHGHKSVNEGGTVARAATPTVSSFSRVIHIRHGGLYRAFVRISDPAHVSGHSAPILIG
jgi:hypothetical protein